MEDESLAAFPTETSLEASLAHKPDAVIVSNPTALHLDVAIPAAEAGCHLLLEKPISHTRDGVADLAAAVERGGGAVLVGYQFRHHPGLVSAKAALEAGEIGRPLSARAVYGEYLPGWHPWEDYRRGYSARADLGGGVVLTLCHPLDYLLWLLGPAQSVWAFTGQLSDLGLDVEDTAEIGIRFGSGALASARLDYNQRPPQHDLQIIGTEGALFWDNAGGALRIYNAAADKWKTSHPPLGFERDDMFRAQMAHFLAVARGEETPLCTLADGIAALDLALAALESGRSGQMVTLNG
jgi:predicted dehydrogenase